MKKTTAFLMAALLACSLLLTSCGSFNYAKEDLSKYIDLGNYKGVAIELTGLEAGKYFVKVEGGDVLNTNIYTIEYTDNGADTSNMSFKELLGNIKWQPLLDNFAGWIGQVNFVKIVKDLVASIIALISSMG